MRMQCTRMDGWMGLIEGKNRCPQETNKKNNSFSTAIECSFYIFEKQETLTLYLCFDFMAFCHLRSSVRDCQPATANHRFQQETSARILHMFSSWHFNAIIVNNKSVSLKCVRMLILKLA